MSSGVGVCSGPLGVGASWGSRSGAEMRANSWAARRSRPIRLKTEGREGVPAVAHW